MATILRYFISGLNADLLDLNTPGSAYSLTGEQVIATGSAGVNHVRAALGVDLDARNLLAGEDVVVFSYRWDQYTKDTTSVSGAIVFSYTDSTSGLTERVTVLNGATTLGRDKLIFADGAVLTQNVNTALKAVPVANINTVALSSVSNVDTLTTTGSYVLPTPAGNTLRAFASTTNTNGVGANFALGEAGQTVIATGSSQADKIYVKAGSVVDARNLLAGEDIIYLAGSWADYGKSLTAVSGAIQFTRTVTVSGQSYNEVVTVLNGATTLGRDKLVFADGAVLTQNVNTALKASLTAAITAVTGYDATTTPLNYAIKGFDKFGDAGGLVESSLTDVVGAQMTNLANQKSALLEGVALAGAKVNFTLGGENRSATADNSGYWSYRLTEQDFLNVGAGPQTITVTSVVYKDGYTNTTPISRDVTFNAVADTLSHPETGYGSDYIDALVYGGAGWKGEVITYSFAPSTNAAEVWSSDEKAAFAKACQTYANVCNLQFVEGNYNSDSYLTTSIVLSKVSSDTWPSQVDAVVLADFNLPTEGYNGWYGALQGRFNYQHDSWSNLTQGGLAFNTVIHELGHGLGLAHPFDGDPTFAGVTKDDYTDLGDNNLNQGIWTIMAYNHGWQNSPATSYDWGFAKTPMIFDVAAVQAMYGANMNYHTGNDVYVLPVAQATGTGWECIWDAGGIDTISNAGASVGCTINLNAYPLTGGRPSELFVSYYSGGQIAGGYTIANGAIVENAIGGNGWDTLIGNEVSNELTGSGGSDQFVFNASLGANNIDTITDFSPEDTIILDAKIFLAWISSSPITDSELKVGAGLTAAQDTDDFLIYNSTTGALYYDADGASNHFAAIQFAQLLNHPVLTASQIFVN